MALLDRLNRRNKNNDNNEMSFVDHLEELRWVLLRSVLAALVGALVLGFNYKWVFENIIMAPSRVNFITYKLMCTAGQKLGMGNGLCIEPFTIKLLSDKMVGQFNMAFTFSFVGGFIVAFPFIFWQFWRFVKPALTDKERKGAGGVIFWVSLLFFLGVAFGYFFLTPYAYNFFATFSLSDQITFLPTVDDYLELLLTFTLGCGLAFQLPIALYFLGKVGIVSARTLRKYFKHAIVAIFIIAAIITPPDGITQIIVATPLVLLYWVSILLVAKVNKEEDKAVEEWS